MGKAKKKKSIDKYNHIPTTLLVAAFGCACAFITVESTFPDVMDMWGHRMNTLQGWQVHMGSVCLGIAAFFVFLFILEMLETASQITAWRSSSPWLPLIGLTALSTVVHIPFYVVILIGTIYGVWAYRQTTRVRRSPRLP